MTIQAQPLAQITQTAIRLLCQEMGVVNTIRFLNQFSAGYGNYTTERDQLFAHLSVDDIAADIKHANLSTDQATTSRTMDSADDA
jgi:hypothetical protein